MVRKHAISLALASAMLSASIPALADVTVKLPSGSQLDRIEVTHALIDNMLNAPSADAINIVSETVPVSGDSFSFALDSIGPSRYSIDFASGEHADLYASPADNLLVQITSLEPLSYTVNGSPLMDGMTAIDNEIRPLEKHFSDLRRASNASEEQLLALLEIYNDTLKDFIAKNPDSPAVVYALMNLEGDDFINAFDALTPAARQSILFPFAERQAEQVRQALAKEKFQRELASGTHDAPNFTFKNLDGKDVSLSDFRGKWVVIDFWGSWCVWCIRGLPELKEAYKEYADRIVILGVACNDTEEAWRAAVKKYEIPWVNLFNPQPRGGELTTAYGIQGYPTKAIVNPEGKLVDITTGEDPSFYTRLADFLK